jgi:hypothetical protein
MRLLLVSCLAVVAFSAGASAQQTPAAAPQPSLQAKNPAYNINTFGDLVQLCGTDRNDPTYVAKVSLCAGYISGVLDYHLADTAWSSGRRNRRVCLPADPPTRLEALQSLVAWNQSNEKYDNEPAVDGVMRYYISTYPCGHVRTPTRG